MCVCPYDKVKYFTRSVFFVIYDMFAPCGPVARPIEIP